MTEEVTLSFKKCLTKIAKIMSDEIVCEERIQGEMLVAKAIDSLWSLEKEFPYLSNNKEFIEKINFIRNKIHYFAEKLSSTDMTQFEYARYQYRKGLKEKGII